MQQCEGSRKDGTRCTKNAMGLAAWERHADDIVAGPEMQGRLCFGCAVGGWSTLSSKAARASHSARRKRKAASAEGIAGMYSYETIIRAVAPALVAVIDEPGFPRVPDWNARLCAVALLLEMQPDWIRSSPEEVRSLLERLLPDAVADARLTPERAYIALALEKNSLRERGHELARAGGS